MRLRKERYVQRCWDMSQSYIDDIKSCKIISNIWVKAAVTRYESNIDDPKYELKEEEVTKVFSFFSVINVDSEGTQFSLLPFQCFVLLNLFGLYISGTGLRKYSYAFLFMGRKNGKTGFISGINLYFLISNSNPLCLSVGSSPDQRGHSAREAAQMVFNTPALDKRLYPQGPQEARNKIVFKDRKKTGSLKAVVSKSEKLDGYNTLSAILDEVHTYADDSLFNVIKSSTGRRYTNKENPLVTLISTAGFRPSGFCASLVNVGKKVMEGVMEDDSFFYMIYTLDDIDNEHFDDDLLWIKANPALDELIGIDYLRREWQQAKNLTTQLPNFLTKHLNIFVNESSEWIAKSVYSRVCYDPDPKDYEHLVGFIGLDLSATRDLTSLVIVFYDSDKEFYYVIPYFWRANNPDKRFRKGGQDLKEWIDQGHIVESTKKTIDYNQVFDKIRELSDTYYIGSIVFDRYLAQLVMPKAESLYRKDGSPISTEPFAQTSYKYSLPMTMLEKSIYDGACSLSSNPVLQWNIDNVVLYYDTNGNVKPMKNRGNDAIDGVVAAAMAFHGALQWHNVSNDEDEKNDSDQ